MGKMGMGKFPSKPPKNPRSLNIALQDQHIQRKFPNFRLNKEDKKWVWVGHLQPTPESKKYIVKIEYCPYKPRVFVLSPKVLERAPHRYDDYSLCLYHPNDKSFDGQTLISDTIIPWTSEWLFFYEGWIKEGVWWGKEAPHSPQRGWE